MRVVFDLRNTATASFVLGLMTIAAAISGSGCAKEQPAQQSRPSEQQPAKRDQVPRSRNFAELQRLNSAAVVQPQPWAGYWWPYVSGGIASSWRDPAGEGPADKYDKAYKEFLKSIGRGTETYKPVADWERINHGPGLGYVASWWGHCNGWAAAALMVPEPQSAKEINGVRFEIRDLKALLTESWMEFSGDFVGRRVDEENDTSSAEFWDVVPAQFHILLTNVVGQQGRGLILDRHTGAEIWNHPLVAYQIDPVTKDDYLGAHPEYPSIYRVNMTARIWWANDNVSPDAITPVFDMERLHDEFNDPYFPGRKLHYELWLDGPVEFDADGQVVKSGDILVMRDDDVYVGGVWKNATNPAVLAHSHPDYLWMTYGLQHSVGYKNPRIDDGWIRQNIGDPGF